uniref:Serine proteinase n=1 Tax=Hadrurus spadix TaxID=141984 RepID=A0A1W7R9J3_9SCOR
MFQPLIILYCTFVALSDWVADYNNDARPLCPTELGPSSRTPEEGHRIVGGEHAGKTTFPFAVGLVYVDPYHERFTRDNIICGGTMITDLHVLTAAHCLNFDIMKYIAYLRVTVSDYDLEDPNEVKSYLRKIRYISLESQYNVITHDNDIAIITLDLPIPLNENMRMVALPFLGRKVRAGTMCTVWGWGLTSHNRTSAVMLKINVPIIHRRVCWQRVFWHITENMICAGGERGKAACEGDSGGSLLLRKGNAYCMIGIVSFGSIECAKNHVPVIYTNVASYTDKIYMATKDASCKPRIL